MILNQLYCGDNLEIMKGLLHDHPHGFIDLIYIDPPFNSKRNYNILYHDMLSDAKENNREPVLREAFKDTWSDIAIDSTLKEIRSSNLSLYNIVTMLRTPLDSASAAYLAMMAIRIHYMHALLKDTGSFYLHCDCTMSAYLKIVCDLIFGKSNFRNEIIWFYKNATLVGGKKYFPRKNQNILFYSKTDSYRFHIQRYPTFTEDIRKRFGKIMEANGDIKYKNAKTERSLLSRALPAFRRKHGRLPEEEEVVFKVEHPKISSVWEDIPQIRQANDSAHLGYPTQKPLPLLERIICASSDEGDLVADFFCGCGTTIAAAQKLKRKWLGVDISHLAIQLMEAKRLSACKASYQVIGFPKAVARTEKLLCSP